MPFPARVWGLATHMRSGRMMLDAQRRKQNANPCVAKVLISVWEGLEWPVKAIWRRGGDSNSR